MAGLCPLPGQVGGRESWNANCCSMECAGSIANSMQSHKMNSTWQSLVGILRSPQCGVEVWYYKALYIGSNAAHTVHIN